MHVPLLELKSQYAPLRAEIEQAIRSICDSQQFVLGAHVAGLEASIASYSQCAHGVGVSSGTDALLLALMALDVGAGDEVITTPYTFFATAGVISRLQATPVFCDIEFPSFNLSATAVRNYIESNCEIVGGRLVNRRTNAAVKAIMPVHLYGQMADMPAFAEIAERYGLKIVEDAAQAIGAELADGRRAGCIGDIGCFSFFPTKNLGAFGDAGMCVTSDSELAERMKVLRVHGGRQRYYHSEVGGNFRLDELQAAVLEIKLKHLDNWTARRQANADLYDSLFGQSGLKGVIEPPSVDRGKRHIFNQYIIRTTDRDGLMAHLAESGVGTAIYYPLALHQQVCFEYLGYSASDFPNAVLASEQTLALPIFPELTPEQIEYVVASIGAFFENRARPEQRLSGSTLGN